MVLVIEDGFMDSNFFKDRSSLGLDTGLLSEVLQLLRYTLN